MDRCFDCEKKGGNGQDRTMLPCMGPLLQMEKCNKNSSVKKGNQTIQRIKKTGQKDKQWNTILTQNIKG